MKGLLAVCFSLVVAGAPKVFGDEQSTSPYATAADFAKYAMKLREQALLKVEPQVLIPTSSRPAVQRYPWKMNIVTTVFWVGEQASGNKSPARAEITFRSRSSRNRILSTSRCLITMSRTANSSRRLR
jgi:hypothetical protein